MCKQIGLGKIDLLVHFLSSMFTKKVALKALIFLIAPSIIHISCSPDPTTNSGSTNPEFSRFFGRKNPQNNK